MATLKQEDVNYTYDDYKLWQGDFAHERYIFEETTYKVSLDFEKVFARFRRRYVKKIGGEFMKKFFVILVLLFSFGVQGWSKSSAPKPTLTCASPSSQIRDVTINELYNGGGGAGSLEMVEIYFNETTNISGWKLYFHDSNTNNNISLGAGNGQVTYPDGSTGKDNKSDTTYPKGTYIVYNINGIDPTNGEVFIANTSSTLTSGASVLVDYFKYYKTTEETSYSVETPSTCSVVLNNTDSNAKDLARLTDGSGDFYQYYPGTTTKITDTAGTSNLDNLPPTSSLKANVSIAADFNQSNAYNGDLVTLTLKITNPSSGSVSVTDVNVTNLIPTGLEYVSNDGGTLLDPTLPSHPYGTVTDTTPTFKWRLIKTSTSWMPSYSGTITMLSLPTGSTAEMNVTLRVNTTCGSTITDDANLSTKQTNNGTKTDTASLNVLCTLPIAEYRMDECSWNGTTAEVKDASTNHLDGTAKNGASTFIGEKINNAALLQHANNQYIEVPDNDLLDGTDKLTITGWINPSSLQNYLGVLSKRLDYNVENAYDIFVNSGGDFVVDTHDQSGYDRHQINQSISTNQWTHFAVVYDGALKQLKIYLNNVLKGTFTTTESSIINSSAPLRIGSLYTPSETRAFDGKLDEIKLFRGALSASQISDLYNNEKAGKNYDGTMRLDSMCIAPIADYRMDECSWSGVSGEVKDSSGNAFNGTAKSGANTDTAKLYKGGVFDNKNYVEVPDKTQLRVTNTYTFSAWIKTTKVTGTIISKTDLNSPWAGYVFAIGPNNGGKLALWNGKDWKASNGATVNDGNWHQVMAVVNGKALQFYVDGATNGSVITLSAITTVSSQPLRIGFENNPGGASRYFSGQIDEVKIFSKAFTPTQINTLYQNENAGKNYDGTVRNSLPCNTLPQPNFSFDAWDSFRSISDRNISTKIVGKLFTLTLNSLNEANNGVQDFNGTVCAEIVNDNNATLSGPNKILFSDQNTSSTSFTINRAIGGSESAGVKLSWKKNVDTTCPISLEDNATIASDRFAVRPASFNISTPNAIAGVDFDINITAPINGASTPSNLYNETSGESFDLNVSEHNKSCATGTFSPALTPFSFVNGNKILTTRYSEVGQVDLNISDEAKPCASRYTHVDCDDANVSDGTNYTASLLPIGTFVKTITIKPHHFDLNATFTNGGDGFTYLSTDLNMSAKLKLSIVAKNDQNVTTQNYNTDCYAQPTSYTISYNKPSDRITPSSNLSKLNYFETNTSTSGNVATSATALTLSNLPKTIFASSDKGSANLSVLVNFDRNETKRVNPFDLNISKVEVSDTDGVIGNDTTVGNATFVYGRIHAYDIQTNQTSTPNPVEIEIYGKNSTNSFLTGKPQNVLYWYRNTDHDSLSEGNITKGGFNAGENSSNVTPDSTITSGIQNMTITASENKTVHLDISPWLWYSSKSYDYSTDCTQHPCFQYKFVNTSNLVDKLNDSSKKGVNSGNFSGSDFEINQSQQTIKKGIKVFR